MLFAFLHKVLPWFSEESDFNLSPNYTFVSKILVLRSALPKVSIQSISFIWHKQTTCNKECIISFTS